MHFDLIIMDVILSDLERLRLLMEYKDINPETEVLAIPGQFIFDKNECMNMGKVLGSDCVLEQPFDIDELKKKAKFLIEKSTS